MLAKILFIGDVVGVTGRSMLKKHIDAVRAKHSIHATIVNGENCADGRGILPRHMEFFKSLKIDVVTSGNHIWDKKDVVSYMAGHTDLLRPANFPPECPGTGLTLFEIMGYPIAIMNVQGRVFMKEHLDCPFRTIESQLRFLSYKTKNIFIDFHAETTSEKAAVALHFDGRISGLVGTHTHVQTADERILPGGTAFITDLGMVGSLNSSLGMKQDSVIQLFLTQMPQRFTVDTQSPVVLSGVVITVDTQTGKATSIERVRVVDDNLILDEQC